jgi:hypothetical protein
MMTFRYDVSYNEYGQTVAEFSHLYCDYEREEPVVEEICRHIAENFDACYIARVSADYESASMVADDTLSPDGIAYAVIEWTIKELGYKFNRGKGYYRNTYEVVVA